MAAQHDLHHGEHAEKHPSPRRYIQIAVVLCVLTLIEFLIFYGRWDSATMTAVILLLSGLKFILVVGYYMHLKFDNWRFSAFFFFPFIIMISIMVALMALFSTLTR